VTKIGIALALVGIVAASGPELRRGAGTRSVVLAVGAAVLFGIAMVLLAEGAQDSPVMTLLGMRAASVLGLVAGIPLVGVLRSRARMRGGDLPLIALAGLGDAGANLLFSLASLRGYISVVAVLASLYPVMTTLLARVVLQQRLLPLQLAGVAAALAGVALVSVG
jgi:drug/metabolite transporter (DMT)-like permease